MYHSMHLYAVQTMKPQLLTMQTQCIAMIISKYRTDFKILIIKERIQHHVKWNVSQQMCHVVQLVLCPSTSNESCNCEETFNIIFALFAEHLHTSDKKKSGPSLRQTGTAINSRNIWCIIFEWDRFNINLHIVS